MAMGKNPELAEVVAVYIGIEKIGIGWLGLQIFKSHEWGGP